MQEKLQHPKGEGKECKVDINFFKKEDCTDYTSTGEEKGLQQAFTNLPQITKQI